MAKPKEITEANGTHAEAERIQFVGIEIVPYKDGAALSLVSGEGENENRMTASLGSQQLRELAARFLVLADAADPSMKASLVVTKKSAWIPGQVLQVRMGPNEQFHYQFLLSSVIATPEMPKLVVPGK